MKVKELIEQLSRLNPEMEVLGEFDSDGDDFMLKADVSEVYIDNGVDDTLMGDEDNEYCIIKLQGSANK